MGARFLVGEWNLCFVLIVNSVAVNGSFSLESILWLILHLVNLIVGLLEVRGPSGRSHLELGPAALAAVAVCSDVGLCL